jgi:orotate phosphoribosyltransferase
VNLLAVGEESPWANPGQLYPAFKSKYKIRLIMASRYIFGCASEIVFGMETGRISVSTWISSALPSTYVRENYWNSKY